MFSKTALGRALFLGALCLVAACSTSARKTRFVESGFLTEYSVLQPGREGQLAWVYLNQAADFTTYDKLLFERITIWLDDDRSKGVESDDLQKIADGLYYAVAAELRKDYELVTEPGPGVMRVRLGLVAIDHPDDQLDVYSTDAAAQLASSPEALPEALIELGRHATVEIELFDDQSREVLAAAVDRWADSGPDVGPVHTWADAHREFESWGKWIRSRLALGRERGL